MTDARTCALMAAVNALRPPHGEVVSIRSGEASWGGWASLDFADGSHMLSGAIYPLTDGRMFAISVQGEGEAGEADAAGQLLAALEGVLIPDKGAHVARLLAAAHGS